MRTARREFDVLVVGGGPAGLAAALCAGKSGARVGIVDGNPTFGGQIWRGECGHESAEAAKWLEHLGEARVERFPGTRVFDAPERNILLGEATGGRLALGYGKLILATGARERFLPFPGWTLPNVMGAGGLQALVRSGLPIRGKRVVVAGTGPLLLAVAAHLRKRGAEIAMICEQASWASLGIFAARLLSHPKKLAEAAKLSMDLRGMRFAPGCWPVRAQGAAVLRAVVVEQRGKQQSIECDYLGCGFHLVPNTELALLLGCELQDRFVKVDDLQRTSCTDVYCAGEPTGIGGVGLAVVEGKIAGMAAVGRVDDAKRLFAPRRKLRAFMQVLDTAFSLRSELQGLPDKDTIVCRCEDVTYGHLKGQVSWRAAKLQTRCGMGPCQGRVCGAATDFLFGWKVDSARPPLFPVEVQHLGNLVVEESALKGQA